MHRLHSIRTNHFLWELGLGDWELTRCQLNHRPREVQSSLQAHPLKPAAASVNSQYQGSEAIRGSAIILAMCAITIRANTVPTAIRKAFISALALYSSGRPPRAGFS